MCEKDFVHLHLHTEYSLLDGFARIDKAIKYAKSLEMKALAITDHGTMFGVIDFYRACKKEEIKPIIGVEAYLAKRSMKDRDPQLDSQPFHMLLLAKNEVGYRNLLKMSSEAQLNGYYYRPRIDWDLMSQCAEGVVATSGCLAAQIPRMVENGREEEARKLIGKYQDTFGKDNFFLELQAHDIPELDKLNRWLIENAPYANVPLVATNDVHYVKQSDFDNHDTLLCIQTSSLKNEANRMRMTDNSYHLRTQAEMWALFGDYPEVLHNTLRIAEMCNLDLDKKEYHLPVFPVPSQFEHAGDYLRHLCGKGLEWRYGSYAHDPKIRERLDYELSVIHKMGFDTYFLIVWDLTQFARHADIWWNVRGSGAGSMVAYTLGITNLDPLENNLLFERFLNPGRVSMPDFDMDFPEDRRAEMIEYCTRKYGQDKVAAIITFGTLGAKGAIKDVGRALEVPLAQVDRITRTIPTVPKLPKIPDLLGEDPEKAIPDLKEIYNSDPTAKRIIDIAAAIEGVPRHASTHAAGVIVADKPLNQYLPLHRPTKGEGGEDSPVKQVTQFPMETAESIGLLKIDFLGLSTLTIMRRACEMIERYHGIKYTMDNIPFKPDPNDPEVTRRVEEMFQMIGEGKTAGVFQLESSGMRQTLLQVRPKTFEHVIAVISLYRPGPMDFIPDYAKRMHGLQEVHYHHPLLEPILSNTYGIITYQEQLMQIGADLFGYSLGEADLMRRAVSKKKAKDLAEHRQIFMERGPEHGVSGDAASKIFDDIEFFANYGFNKCLVGNTLIQDAATGRLHKIGDLAAGQVQLSETLTLNTDHLRLASGQITAVMENGVKPVFRLTTQLGRQIEATANHPFYTFNGWQMLGELAIGQRIAVPRRLPVEGKQEWADQDVLDLAGWLSDGGDQLPDDVFELNNPQVALLMDYLFNPTNESTWQTPSASVAHGIQHLLLRLGMLSEIRLNEYGFEVRFVHSGTTTDDIYWDRVESIEYIGEEMTYDLTIEGTHNFVANDIIVHNSHAADYAVITCQTAYLKCHYPHEYMAALMSVYFDVAAKVSLFIADCRHMGIDVLPPNVNSSYLDFAIEKVKDGKRCIRFGLGAIKNLGVGAVEYLLRCRQDTPFASLDDFLKRCDMRELGKRGLESLIRVGALDAFGDRSRMLANLDRLVTYSGEHHKNAASGQVSMFDLMGSSSSAAGTVESAMTEAPPKDWDKREQLRWERDLLGLFISDHPLTAIWGDLQDAITHTTADLAEEAESVKDKQVSVAGLITNIRSLHTKKGDAMAILTLEDIQGSIECVMFPRTWQQHRETLAIDKVYIVRGKADLRGNDVNIIVDSVGQDFFQTRAVVDTPQPSFLSRRMAELDLDMMDEETGEVVREVAPPEPAPETAVAPATVGASYNNYRILPTSTLEEPEEMREAFDRPVQEPDETPMDDWSDMQPIRTPKKLIDQQTNKLIPPPAPAAVPASSLKTQRLMIEMERSGELDRDRRRLRFLVEHVKQFPGKDEFCILVKKLDGDIVRMEFPAVKIGVHRDLLEELSAREGVRKVWVEK